MQNSPLKSYATTLHRNLQGQLLSICQNEVLSCTKKLGKAIQVFAHSISELYQLIPEQGFGNLAEEILFLKSVKPLFAAEREYRQRLYHAKMFGDETDIFWKHELVRIEWILNEPTEFVSYYHNNLTHNDEAWFSQGQAPFPTTLCMLPWETNPRHTSARDSWVSGLIAVERYRNRLRAKNSEVASKS